MTSEQFLNWIISNPEFAGLAMFIIGFLEAFIISVTVWPSILLFLFAVGLSEGDTPLHYLGHIQAARAGDGHTRRGSRHSLHFHPQT